MPIPGQKCIFIQEEKDRVVEPPDRIFKDKEIRDTNAHNSDVVDCINYNVMTIWIENGLDQNISVQVKGNRVNSVTDAVDVGNAFNVATLDREAMTIVPANEGFLPCIFIEVTAAGVPIISNLNAYLIKKLI